VVIPGTGKKDTAQHNQVAIKQLYHNKYYFEKNKQVEMEKQLFITRWRDDEYIKIYKGFVIDPDCTRTDVHNLWRPYIAAEYPPVGPVSVNKLTHNQPQVITSDNEEHTQLILDYLANC
jgi:hypothetical protein